MVIDSPTHSDSPTHNQSQSYTWSVTVLLMVSRRVLLMVTPTHGQSQTIWCQFCILPPLMFWLAVRCFPVYAHHLMIGLPKYAHHFNCWLRALALRHL